MSTFHFLRPEWLWGFLPLGVLLVLLAKRGAMAQLWESVCDVHLLPHVLVGTTGTKSNAPFILVGLGWALALVALAGPVWSQLPQPVFRAESALVIILDGSRSMDAQDVPPSRLTRAKHKILDILQARKEGQTALVIFAGEPFVVSPLTDDARTMKTLVQTLETNLMPVQGSRPDLALHMGHELLEQAGIPGGDLLLITDGEADPTTVSTMKQIATKGRRISILGVGTEEGAPIPETGGFVKDQSGTIVVPKLHSDSLQAAAQAAGGRYATVALDDRDLHLVMPAVHTSGISTTPMPQQRMTDIWQEEGPWLVVALLVVALPAFRRGWVGVVLLCLLLPQVSQAFSWENMWERSDQRAMKALEHNDPKKAATLFEKPEWKGIAEYRAGDYEQAEQTFSKSDSPEGHYNRGNALARLGKYPEAMASYQAALTKQPDHEDAQHNFDLLKKLLENQQAESSQENESDSSMGDQQEKANGKQSKQQGQEQKSEQSNQEKNPGQAASQDHEQEAENDTSGSSQDSSEEVKPSEKSRLQNPSQDLADKTESSEIAQPSLEEKAKDADSQEQMASASQSEEAREDQKSEQALQQWLRRIPDDPGGLLRRKFLLEHRRRLEAGMAVDSSERPW